MDAKKRRLYVFIVLVAVSIWGYYNIFDKADKKPDLIEDEELTDVARPAAAPRPVAIDYDEYSSKDWGSDPFFRGKVEKQEIVEIEPEKMYWFLGGILYSDNNPAAVINKRVVCKGDVIDGARVVEINRNDVVLEKDGENIVLGLKKERS